jgi:hypothetical protein
MYNKEELINAMLDKRLPKIYSHITSLKDVKELTISTSKQEEENKIICPISMIEFSGLNSFYFFWNCGCLISKKAFDELQMKDKCVLCGKKFDKEKDIVDLNHTKEERAQIFQRLILEKIKEKKIKDEKKIEKKEKDINKLTNNNIDIQIKNLNECEKLNKNSKLNKNTNEFNDKNYGSFKNGNFFEKENKNKNEINEFDIEFINKKRKRS